MTELGDAQATEPEVVAASGLVTPAAARLYLKRTSGSVQPPRANGASFLALEKEQEGDTTRNEVPAGNSE